MERAVALERGHLAVFDFIENFFGGCEHLFTTQAGDVSVAFVHAAEVLKQVRIRQGNGGAGDGWAADHFRPLDDMEDPDRGIHAGGGPCCILIDCGRVERAVGAGDDGEHGDEGNPSQYGRG